MQWGGWAGWCVAGVELALALSGPGPLACLHYAVPALQWVVANALGPEDELHLVCVALPIPFPVRALEGRDGGVSGRVWGGLEGVHGAAHPVPGAHPSWEERREDAHRLVHTPAGAGVAVVVRRLGGWQCFVSSSAPGFR